MKSCRLIQFCLLCFACGVGGSSLAWADTGEKSGRASGVSVVTITGWISNRTLDNVVVAPPTFKDDPIPAGLIVLLDSAGGDGVAAMKIGRLLRLARAHIFVTGQCSSACMFILASGVVRGAPAYTVGIHRGRITVTDPEGKILKEVDASENPKATEALKKFENDAKVYFAEMGMTASLFQTMQAHTHKGVYRLSHTELANFNLIGFESRYLADRVQFFEGQNGAFKMNGAELRSRTAKVASRCGEFQSDRKSFITCYSEVLSDRYLN